MHRTGYYLHYEYFDRYNIHLTFPFKSNMYNAEATILQKLF